jgi:phosphate transport system substrate-binding protein
MFRKNVHLSLAQALSVTAALTAVLTAVPSAQAQSTVSADPRAVVTSDNPLSGGGSNPFIIAPTSTQHHAAGATFPQILFRRFADYYGIAVPTGSTNLGATGIQPLTPPGSPVFDGHQYNYCGTGSGTGRNLYLQSLISAGARVSTSSFPVSCTYIPSTSGLVQTPNTATPYAANPSAPFGSFTSSPLLFGGTDAELTSLPTPVVCPGTLPATATEVEVYRCNTANPGGATLESTRGNAIQVPIGFGGVAVAYNSTSPGPAVFNISTADLCRIFDRTSNGGTGLTNFNQLTAPSTTTATSIPITVQVRSDNSGTTSAFTAFLAKACPTALGTPYYLTAAVNNFPTGANTAGFVRSNGNGGVSTAIQATAGSLGYVEASFTSLFAAGGPTAAGLQNGATPVAFTRPNTNAVRATVATGITLTADATYPNVRTVNGLISSPTAVIPTAIGSYPIVSATYALLYSNYPTQKEVDSIKNLFLSIFSNRQTIPTLGANDSIAQSLGFALPSNQIRGTIRGIINSIVKLP